MLNHLSCAGQARYLIIGLLALLLAGCGGGGAGGCVNIDPSRDPALPSCSGSTGSSSSTGTTASTNVSLKLTDSSGAGANAISPQNAGTLVAVVTDSKGSPVPNTAVTFSSTDKSAVFAPPAGSALTDSSGRATIIVYAGSVAGAYTATASVTVGTTTTSASIGYSVTSTVQPITLKLTDSSGASTTTITPQKPGTITATVVNSNGAPQANVPVSFVSTDTTAVFSPSSGTALTNASGVATIGLAPGSKAGGFAVTASTTVANAPVTATLAYTAAFDALTLSDLIITPTTLSAGGNASISVTVLSGGSAYLPSLPVSFTSTCSASGKAAIGSPVYTQQGVATASYTDKGCGTTDVITATITTPSATVSKTGQLVVLAPTAGSLKFENAVMTNIALKGTGGFGRPEFSTLTFRVYDTSGATLAGKSVSFTFADTGATSTIGGLSLYPASAISAADGTVSTVVNAGTIPTSVRVVATITGSSPLITTLSNVLVVSTGIPDQRHFSIATSNGNCEGLEIDQDCSIITVGAADHFGNPVPDGTAINFTAEGGFIQASCVTGSLLLPGASPGGTTNGSQTTNSQIGPGSGTCSVIYRASQPRPADGRVTILAYALGEENFTDTNGNNVYNTGEPFTDMSPDIFRDDVETGVYVPGEPCIGPNTNGTCTTPGDGVYNGVLRSPQVPSPQTLRVSAQLVQLLSGSSGTISFNPTALTCAAGGTTTVTVTVADQLGHMPPSGTKIEFSTLFGITAGPVFPASVTTPAIALGIGGSAAPKSYSVTIGCPTPLPAASGKFSVKVTTPSGRGPDSASIPIN